MLEQRSEILSHYCRLDFFFFFFEQSPVPISRKRAQIQICQMATHTADYDFWAMQSPLAWCMGNPKATWQSHRVHTLWPYLSECKNCSTLLVQKASYLSLLLRGVCRCFSPCHWGDPAACPPSLCSCPPSPAHRSEAHLPLKDIPWRQEWFACNRDHIFTQGKEK